VPVHDVAFVELHVSVDDKPTTSEVGFAESVAVGATTGALTVTVAEEETVWKPSVQVIEYVTEEAGETISDPEIAPPVEKLVPVHEVT